MRPASTRLVMPHPSRGRDGGASLKRGDAGRGRDATVRDVIATIRDVAEMLALSEAIEATREVSDRRGSRRPKRAHAALGLGRGHSPWRRSTNA